MLYTNVINMPDNKNYIAVSFVPIESKDWEQAHFLVPCDPQDFTTVTHNLVRNVLVAGGAEVVMG